MLSTAEANRQPIETTDRPTNLLTQITESITLPSQFWIMHFKDVKIFKLQDNKGCYRTSFLLIVFICLPYVALKLPHPTSAILEV